MCAKFQFFRLIWKKIDWYLYVHTKVDSCAKFQFSRLLFIFINFYQLLTADMKKNSIGIFMYLLKLILVPNFSPLSWFSFLSTVISCHQLLTAVNCWWQLIWKKFDCNFYAYTKVDTCAKFQLSGLIFNFINCYQLSKLLTAEDCRF